MFITPDLHAEMIAWRHDLHQHPEPGSTWSARPPVWPNCWQALG